MGTRKVILVLVLPFCLAFLGSQSLSLADFRMETTGYLPEGASAPLFVSSSVLAGRFVPASWIQLKAQTSLFIPDTAAFFHPIPDSNIPGTIVFDGFSIKLPLFLDSPLDFSLFTGYFDDPASGSLLREYLKITIVPCEFHEKPAGSAFSPNTGITGTGISLSSIPGNRNLLLALYGYWNTRTDSNAVSTYDIRLAAANALFLLNTFGGVSVGMTSGTATLRGGITSLFGAGSRNELYTEIGINNFTPGSSQSERNLYLLFEPRIHLDNADLALSFFSSPVFPANLPGYVIPDSESNFIGANILAGFGNLGIHGMRGGISLLGCINPGDPGSFTPFTFSVSPFYSLRVSDFEFDITAVIKPLLIPDPYSMGELQLRVKAVY